MNIIVLRKAMLRIVIAFVVVLPVIGSLLASKQAFAQGLGTFSSTGNLNTGRNAHRGIALNSGQILIAGGYDANENALAASELYDVANKIFIPTGSLNTARRNFSITLLDNGTVLVAGGVDANFNPLASAEIYDPAAGVFTLTGNLNTPRANHSATLLNNGTVLIAGGFDSSGSSLSSAELYIPQTGSFVLTGSLNSARQWSTATALMDGTVLIAGGWANGGVLSSGELYDPSASSFSTTGSLNVGRVQGTATLLNGGNVLIAGGKSTVTNFLNSAELYSPAAGTFTLTGSMSAARGNHRATLLTNGTVLVEAGFACDPSNCATTEMNMSGAAEVYDPILASFSPTGSMTTARQVHTATLMSDGTVLIAGGWSGSNPALSSAEIYQPASLTPQNLVSISLNPVNPSLLTGTSQALLAVGTFADNSMQTLASVIWSSSDNTVATVTNDSGSNSGITNDSTNSGVVYGVAAGTATVTACAGTVCGSTTIAVLPTGSAQGVVVKATPQTVSVAPGEPAIFSLSLMPENQRSSQKMSLSCTGAPPGAQCIVSPTHLTLSAIVNSNATVTVTTSAPFSRSAASSVVGYLTQSWARSFCFPMFATVLLLSLCFCFSATRRLRTIGAILLTIVFACELMACSSSATGARGISGTPSGNYRIVVTAISSGANSNTALNLVVK